MSKETDSATSPPPYEEAWFERVTFGREDARVLVGAVVPDGVVAHVVHKAADEDAEVYLKRTRKDAWSDEMEEHGFIPFSLNFIEPSKDGDRPVERYINPYRMCGRPVRWRDGDKTLEGIVLSFNTNSAYCFRVLLAGTDEKPETVQDGWTDAIVKVRLARVPFQIGEKVGGARGEMRWFGPQE